MRVFPSGKRTRPKSAAGQHAGKFPKHKRAWSISSTSSAADHVPPEEDLHYKVQQQQGMLTGTHPVSILYLRGAKQDDPDLHPVTRPGGPWDVTKVYSHESTA